MLLSLLKEGHSSHNSDDLQKRLDTLVKGAGAQSRSGANSGDIEMVERNGQKDEATTEDKADEESSGSDDEDYMGYSVDFMDGESENDQEDLPEAFYDPTDCVYRCMDCSWEVVDGLCSHCDLRHVVYLVEVRMQCLHPTASNKIKC